MAAKRKISTQKVGGNSRADKDAAKRLRTVDLFDTEDAVEPVSETQQTQRRSLRAGRGRGGAIQQLQRIEDVQVGRASRQATRNLDIATEGQDFNPMAPSYTPANDEASQVPPWTTSSAPLVQAQPTFAIAQSDQRFGFRLPYQTNRHAGTMSALHSGATLAARGPPSTASSSSIPSSRHSLLTGASYTASTAPTSRAPSECGSRSEYSAIIDFQPSESRRRVSQPEASSQAVQSLGTLVQHQEPTGDASGSPLRCRAEVRETRSFNPLPSTLSRSHTTFFTDLDVGGGARQSTATRFNSPAIDEQSPDEDERLAVSVLRGQRNSESAQHETPANTSGGNDDVADLDFNGLYEQREQSVVDRGVLEAEEEDGVVHRHRDDLLPRPGNGQLLALAEADVGNDRPSSGLRTARIYVPEGEVEDVIQQHRQRNRPPRLPNNVQLLAARDQQSLQRTRSVSRAISDELEAPLSAQAPADASTPVVPSTTVDPAMFTTAAARSDNTDPSQLHFYPPPVRDVIERAKQFSHCDLASVNSFPVRPQFNMKAVEYMDEAIEERRTKGLTIPNGWWPQYETGITKLLWEDIGNWRSSLKKKARGIVRQSYEWDPQNRRSVNADTAKSLLDRGSFLMHGVDEDGRTNNLAHPALASLVVDFFYTGSNAMGNLFPEIFKDEVPRSTVGLAATAIKVALDEIVAEGKEVLFKREVYTDVYLDIIALMAKCDTAPIHRAKTKALRMHWAKMGRNGNASVGTSTGFDVNLD